MQLLKETTVALTGHCPEKIGCADNQKDDVILEIYRQTCHAIAELYSSGFDTFIVGTGRGFDLIAAHAALFVRNQGICIRIIPVIPYKGHSNDYDKITTMVYEDILSQCDETVTLAEDYDSDSHCIYCDFILDNSSCLVCYYKGIPGGTQYIVDRAQSLNKDIINIADRLEDDFINFPN